MTTYSGLHKHIMYVWNMLGNIHFYNIFMRWEYSSRCFLSSNLDTVVRETDTLVVECAIILVKTIESEVIITIVIANEIKFNYKTRITKKKNKNSEPMYLIIISTQMSFYLVIGSLILLFKICMHWFYSENKLKLIFKSKRPYKSINSSVILKKIEFFFHFNIFLLWLGTYLSEKNKIAYIVFYC